MFPYLSLNGRIAFYKPCYLVYADRPFLALLPQEGSDNGANLTIRGSIAQGLLSKYLGD